MFRSGSLLQSGFSVKQFDADIFGNSEQAFQITPEQRIGGWFNRQHRGAAATNCLKFSTCRKKNARQAHTQARLI